MEQALLSSKKHDWRTPDEVLDLVRAVDCIELDPCTEPGNPTRALRFFHPLSGDGLEVSWQTDGVGLVFCNPPYGRALPAWTKKAAEEGKGSEVILLVPARPDTKWFQENVCQADEILFWKGRMKFKGAKDPAPFPTLLAYWGPAPERFREVFRGCGVFASELCQ